MSVMLANRYVQAHRFADALPFFEAVLRKHPDDYSATLKLILCYAQTGRFAECIDLMVNLLEHAPEQVLERNPDLECAPARYVIKAVERRRSVQPPDLHHAGLAVLYLYTDPRRACAELDAARRAGCTVAGLDRLERLIRDHLEEPT